MTTKSGGLIILMYTSIMTKINLKLMFKPHEDKRWHGRGSNWFCNLLKVQRRHQEPIIILTSHDTYVIDQGARLMKK